MVLPIVFGLLVAAISVLFALFITGIALLVCGIVCTGVGIWALIQAFTQIVAWPAAAMIGIGISLAAIGIGVLVTMLMGWLIGKVVPAGVRALCNCLHRDCDEKRRQGSMKNWKKGMIAGSIICIAAGFLFIGIGSSMGGWKNIDQINSRYIHFGGSDTFIGLNFPANTKESIQILSRETDSPADAGNDSTGEVISFNGKSPEKMEISANTLALKIVPGESDAIILSGSNRDKMNCYIEDNCLYLEEKNHKPLQKSGEIVLTVPESMDWKKIEIDVEAAYVALQNFSRKWNFRQALEALKHPGCRRKS